MIILGQGGTGKTFLVTDICIPLVSWAFSTGRRGGAAVGGCLFACTGKCHFNRKDPSADVAQRVRYACAIACEQEHGSGS